MTTDERIREHCERAIDELDLALRARSVPAAKAHFGLSSLHLDRMRSLNGGIMPGITG
ncbi:MAG TPA: hypothetical protein VGW34_05500 [Allosphingosinicella sp.]|nr:hypothetical protein [Allosphingosinicella sp.]